MLTMDTTSMMMTWYCGLEDFFCFVFAYVFYNDIHPIQGPRATGGREIQSKKHSLCWYMGKIMVGSRIEQVKIVVIRKHLLGSHFHKLVCGKKLIGWNLAMVYEGNKGS